ncbi:MAG: hypothetical protein KDC44_16565, partial [Phaeodactylibacter sp.]|nr:hypothetical protein [Phaeodactylibacter sp.]
MVLYKLLACISPDESDALLDFLASPYFNKNDRLHRLAELLLVHAPDFKRVNRSDLFRHLFPGEALDRQRLNEHYSQLAALVRTFLWQQQLQAQPELSHNARFAAFQDRRLLRDFRKLAKTEA